MYKGKYIPQSDNNAVSLKNPDVIACFDVDANGWRSFHISRLESYSGLVRFNENGEVV
jgi:hypothetical protein